MTKGELIFTVKSIFSTNNSDEEISSTLTTLSRALPHAEISDLIFWNDPDLTPEEVVEVALRREKEYAARHGGEPYEDPT